MVAGKIRPFLLRSVLFTYNAVVSVIMGYVMWRNHSWNEKKWTKKP